MSNYVPAYAEEQKNEEYATIQQQAAEVVNEGLNYLILEQNKKAEECFIKALSLDPYSEQAYNFLGLLYMQDNLNDKAEEMLKKAIAIEPMYPEAMRNLGKLYLRQDKFKEASVYLKRTLSIDDRQAYTWYLLGMAQYFSGNVEEAIDSYEKAFSMESGLPIEAHYNLGVAYHENAQFLNAAKEYEEVIKLDPNHINAYNNLGLVYSIVGEREKAISLFNKVLEIDPTNIKARINLGNVYLSTSDLVEAEQIYRSAISIDKSDISPRLNLGVVYYKQGDFVKAKSEWESLLSENPNSVRILSVMGSAYLERHEYDRAIDIFKRIINIMPENGSISNTLGYLLAERDKELDYAEKLIEKAITLDKANRATYYDSLAWVYYKQHKYEQAYKILDKSIKIFKLSHTPISTDVYYHMGKLREIRNQYELAGESYKMAIQSNTDAEIVKLASESLALLEKHK